MTWLGSEHPGDCGKSCGGQPPSAPWAAVLVDSSKMSKAAHDPELPVRQGDQGGESIQRAAKPKRTRTRTGAGGLLFYERVPPLSGSSGWPLVNLPVPHSLSSLSIFLWLLHYQLITKFLPGL